MSASPPPKSPADTLSLREKAETLLVQTQNQQTEIGNTELAELIQELSVHHVELELQNEELRHLGVELESSRQYQRQLFIHAPVGFMVLGRDCRIRDVNDHAVKLIGLNRQILLGQRLQSFIPEEIFYTFNSALTEFLTTGISQRMEAMFRAKAGHNFWALLELFLLTASDDDQGAILCAFTDISREKEAARLLADDNAKLEVLVKQRTAELDETVRTLQREIAEKERMATSLDQAYGLLEQRVSERTAELTETNKRLAHEVEEHLRTAKRLRQHEEDLAARTRNLEESNVALHVLLTKREQDKQDLEEQVLASINKLVLPYLDKLRSDYLSDRQRMYLECLTVGLGEITSRFATKLSGVMVNLTPAELQIADMVKHGRSTKEIAHLLGISPATVAVHRKKIRKKCGISNLKSNLRTRLSSFSD